MTITSLIHFGLAISFASMATFCSAQYNASPTLNIGDPAPPIQVQTWVRGKPLVQFEKGRVYVVDFWATWCGGCVTSFPHISGIAEKYKDKAAFVSIDSYEDVGENKGKDVPIAVKNFLQSPIGQNLTLDVGVDGATNEMFRTWIKPLRRAGFPTTFIIDQDGKIAWIDVNLDHLDWALSQVVAKTWDRDKAAAIMQQRDAVDDLMMTTFRDSGPNHGKKVRAMLVASEAFEKRFPDRRDAVAFYKFMALLEVDKDMLPDLLNQMAADPRSRYLNLMDAAGLSLREKNLSKRTYGAVAKVLERCLDNEFLAPNTGGSASSILGYIAEAYDKAGQPAKAVASVKAALSKANEERVPVDQVQKLQQALQNYSDVAARNN